MYNIYFIRLNSLKCANSSFNNKFPLKIVFTKEGNALKAQASGQPAFTLEAVSKDVFKCDPAGRRVEFDATQPAFKLKQGGGEFAFRKE